MRRNPMALLILALAVLLASGCDEDDPSESYSPWDCEEDRPDTGVLGVTVTINAENPRVPLTVYAGNYEDDVVVFRDTLAVSDVSYDLPADVRYSATATYAVGEQTHIALDDGYIDLKYTDYIDARCWEVDDVHVDLRLAGKLTASKGRPSDMP